MRGTDRAGRWAMTLLLYAGQLLLIVLAAGLFIDVVIIITPQLLAGQLPSRGVAFVAAALLAAMVVLAFVTALPAALRTAFRRPGTDLTDAGREMATSVSGCVVLITGLSLIALVASLPVLVVRLLLRLI